MDRTTTAVIARCQELRRYWLPRNQKMKSWYKLIEMVDELKTDRMESFVGNDPRSLFNLVLHMLDIQPPIRIDDYNLVDMEEAAAAASVSGFFSTAYKDISTRFRRSGPRQSLSRSRIG